MTDSDGDNYKIQLTKEKNTINSLDAFDNLYVNNMQGMAIPLTQVASLKLESSPLTINHQIK